MAADDGKGPLILAFGDSLYAGYRLSPTEGFAPELERALNRARGDGTPPVRVHNAGVSGDTTAAGRRRLTFVLDSLPEKPALVLVGLGGNDVLRGLKPTETRANLSAILDELRKRDLPIMLTGMVAPGNLGAMFGSDFNAIYPDLAKEYDAPLYPFFLDGLPGRRDLLLPDGIHPNEAGIDLIVERIAPEVADALANGA